MSTRRLLSAPLFALALYGCVDRGGWQPTPQLAPQGLSLSRTAADSQVEPAAWPDAGWWRRYGAPQLDALVDEARSGSPSLATAQARLRAARDSAVRLSVPIVLVKFSATRSTMRKRRPGFSTTRQSHATSAEPISNP